MVTQAVAPDARASVHREPVHQRPLPSWPVTAMVAAFPIWWALGLSLVMPLVLAGVMLAMMLLRRRIEIVPGVIPWVGFCVWVVPCALMLDTGLRLVGYGLRSAQLFSVAITLLYVVNARETFTLRKSVLVGTWLWVAVVAGGYLGMTWPEVRLTTIPGMLLPGALAEDEYLRDLFFPPLAEVQQPWGSPEPFNRPAAPFPYSNNWGGAIAILTPIALAAIGVVRRHAVRVGILLVLIASLGPIGASSNRGMFLALAGALGYVAIRLAVRGHWAPFVGLAAVGLSGWIYYRYGGVAAGIESRQTYSDTTEGRGILYVETLERTLQSPILGYGAPRPSNTVEVSVGTQGWIWTLMFSYGFVGLALFLVFLFGVVIRCWRAPGTVRLLMHSSLIAVCVMISYYGLSIAQLSVIAVISGVLLRDRAQGESVASPGSSIGAR